MKDLLESCGFEVIAVYGKELSERKSAYFINTGRKNKISMVVDNLDSYIGKSIAENIHAKYAVISNATLKNSYVDTLKDNAAKLKKAL